MDCGERVSDDRSAEDRQATCEVSVVLIFLDCLLQCYCASLTYSCRNCMTLVLDIATTFKIGMSHVISER